MSSSTLGQLIELNASENLVKEFLRVGPRSNSAQEDVEALLSEIKKEKSLLLTSLGKKFISAGAPPPERVTNETIGAAKQCDALYKTIEKIVDAFEYTSSMNVSNLLSSRKSSDGVAGERSYVDILSDMVVSIENFRKKPNEKIGENLAPRTPWLWYASAGFSLKSVSFPPTSGSHNAVKTYTVFESDLRAVAEKAGEFSGYVVENIVTALNGLSSNPSVPQFGMKSSGSGPTDEWIQLIEMVEEAFFLFHKRMLTLMFWGLLSLFSGDEGVGSRELFSVFATLDKNSQVNLNFTGSKISDRLLSLIRNDFLSLTVPEFNIGKLTKVIGSASQTVKEQQLRMPRVRLSNDKEMNTLLNDICETIITRTSELDREFSLVQDEMRLKLMGLNQTTLPGVERELKELQYNFGPLERLAAKRTIGVYFDVLQQTLVSRMSEKLFQMRNAAAEQERKGANAQSFSNLLNEKDSSPQELSEILQKFRAEKLGRGKFDKGLDPEKYVERLILQQLTESPLPAVQEATEGTMPRASRMIEYSKESYLRPATQSTASRPTTQASSRLSAPASVQTPKQAPAKQAMGVKQTPLQQQSAVRHVVPTSQQTPSASNIRSVPSETSDSPTEKPVALSMEKKKLQDLVKLYPFLSREPLSGIYLEDLSFAEHPMFRAAINRLIVKRHNSGVAARKDEVREQEQVVNKVIVSIARDLKEETLYAAEKMPFLPIRMNCTLLGALVPLFDQNETFQNHMQSKRKLLENPNPSFADIRSVNQNILIVANAIAARVEPPVDEEQCRKSIVVLQRQMKVPENSLESAVLEQPLTPTPPKETIGHVSPRPELTQSSASSFKAEPASQETSVKASQPVETPSVRGVSPSQTSAGNPLAKQPMGHPSPQQTPLGSSYSSRSSLLASARLSSPAVKTPGAAAGAPPQHPTPAPPKVTSTKMGAAEASLSGSTLPISKRSPPHAAQAPVQAERRGQSPEASKTTAPAPLQRPGQSVSKQPALPAPGKGLGSPGPGPAPHGVTPAPGPGPAPHGVTPAPGPGPAPHGVTPAPGPGAKMAPGSALGPKAAPIPGSGGKGPSDPLTTSVRKTVGMTRPPEASGSAPTASAVDGGAMMKDNSPVHRPVSNVAAKGMPRHPSGPHGMKKGPPLTAGVAKKMGPMPMHSAKNPAPLSTSSQKSPAGSRVGPPPNQQGQGQTCISPESSRGESPCAAPSLRANTQPINVQNNTTERKPEDFQRRPTSPSSCTSAGASPESSPAKQPHPIARPAQPVRSFAKAPAASLLSSPAQRLTSVEKPSERSPETSQSISKVSAVMAYPSHLETNEEEKKNSAPTAKPRSNSPAKSRSNSSAKSRSNSPALSREETSASQPHKSYFSTRLAGAIEEADSSMSKTLESGLIVKIPQNQPTMKQQPVSSSKAQHLSDESSGGLTATPVGSTPTNTPLPPQNVHRTTNSRPNTKQRYTGVSLGTPTASRVGSNAGTVTRGTSPSSAAAVTLEQYRKTGMMRFAQPVIKKHESPLPAPASSSSSAAPHSATAAPPRVSSLSPTTTTGGTVGGFNTTLGSSRLGGTGGSEHRHSVLFAMKEGVATGNIARSGTPLKVADLSTTSSYTRNTANVASTLMHLNKSSSNVSSARQSDGGTSPTHRSGPPSPSKYRTPNFIPTKERSPPQNSSATAAPPREDQKPYSHSDYSASRNHRSSSLSLNHHEQVPPNSSLYRTPERQTENPVSPAGRHYSQSEREEALSGTTRQTADEVINAEKEIERLQNKLAALEEQERLRTAEVEAWATTRTSEIAGMQRQPRLSDRFADRPHSQPNNADTKKPQPEDQWKSASYSAGTANAILDPVEDLYPVTGLKKCSPGNRSPQRNSPQRVSDSIGSEMLPKMDATKIRSLLHFRRKREEQENVRSAAPGRAAPNSPTKDSVPSLTAAGQPRPVISATVSRTRYVRESGPRLGQRSAAAPVVPFSDTLNTNQNTSRSNSAGSSRSASVSLNISSPYANLLKEQEQQIQMTSGRSGASDPGKAEFFRSLTPPRRNENSPRRGTPQQRRTSEALKTAAEVARSARKRPYISHLSECCNLAEVYVEACKVLGLRPNSVLQRTFPSRRGEFLERIDLSINYVGAKGLQPLFYVMEENSNHLLHLNLSSNNLENTEVLELLEVLCGEAGERLNSLDLSYNPISQSGGQAIYRLSKARPNLVSVQLKGTLIPPRLLQSIVENVEENAYRQHIGV